MASDNGSFLGGLFVGAAIGAIAGILFAPKAGKDTREELLGESDDIIGKAKSELDKMRKELGDLKEKLSKKSTVTKPSDTAEERAYEDSLSSIDEDEA